jgi:hypothetical protein
VGRRGGLVGRGREDGSNFDFLFSGRGIAEDGELVGLGLGLDTFKVKFGVRGVLDG